MKLRTAPISFATLLLLAFLLLLPLGALLHLKQSIPDALLFGGFGVIICSILSYATVAYDKKRALIQEWRVPEAVLHGLELCGGWPGSFLAQRSFRHKTSKLSYQLQFYGIIAIHQVLAWALIEGKVRI